MRSVRILVGVVLTIVGTIWLVDRQGGVPQSISFLVRWSPAVLVMLGGLQALSLLRHSRLLAPFVLVGAGAGALLGLHSSMSDAAGPLFWPLFVLTAGSAVALFDRGQQLSDEPILEETALLRTRTVVRTEREFTVGRARALLGSLELDLTRCQLPADAYLHVTVWFGHVSMVVPDRYQVDVGSNAVAVHVPLLPAIPAGDRDRAVVLHVSMLGFAGAVDVRRSWTQLTLPPEDLEEEEHEATASATASLRG